MRANTFGLIAALVAGSLLASVAVVSAQEAKQERKGDRRGWGNPEQRVEMMDKELQLTADQKKKLTALFEQQNKKRQELANATPEERREKARAMMEDNNKKLKEILTTEQYAKWEKQREEFRKKGGFAPGERKGEGKSETQKKKKSE